MYHSGTLTVISPDLNSMRIGMSTSCLEQSIIGLSARNLARSMRSYHFWAIGISLFSGVSGLIVSYYLGTAAGGTIVLIAAAIFFVTYVLGHAGGKSRVGRFL